MPDDHIFKKLRSEAETLLETNVADLDETTYMDIKKLFHEIQVYKIELSLQNESLKESQRELTAALDSFSLLYDQAPVGYVVLDSSGIIIQANMTFSDMVGVPVGSLPFRPFVDFIEQDGRHVFNSRFRSFFANPEGKSIEAPIRGKTSPIFARLQGAQATLPLIDKNANGKPGETAVGSGKPDRLLMTVSDISERKKAEELLKTSEARLNAIFESVQDAIFLKDHDHHYMQINPGMSAMLHTAPSEILGKNDFAIFPGKEAEKMHKSDDAVYSGETSREEHTVPVAGEMRTFDIIKTPILNDLDEIIGLCGISRDITPQKDMEHSLSTALEDAHAASRAKSEFLANMSHELRTPLNGVLGMLQLLKDSPLTEEQNEHVDIAMDSSQSLLALLNDVLDLARIEAQRLPLEHTPFNLADVLSSISKPLAEQARKRGLEFESTLDVGTPAQVLGDVARTRQILYNLVGNAIKYTESGGVKVEIYSRPALTPSGKHQLFFHVQDTGIGIPDEKLAHIFDSFTQADGSHTRRYGGSGLGLSIVQKLVSFMGGTLTISSQVGVGTEIMVSLYVEPPSSELVTCELGDEELEQTHATTGDQKVFNILLAEDEYVNQICISKMLHKYKHRVTTVKNGKQAIDALENGSFDLVLMDIQMPYLDGVEATRMVRKGHVSNCPASIPIIALTAHAMPGDRENFLASGMNGYLAKPVKIRELIKTVERVMCDALH